MSNPFSNLLTPVLKQQYKYAIDAVIENCEIPCRLYYPVTKYITCTNCSQTISGNSPNPFLAGNKGKFTTSCNVCGGDGKIPVESYDDLDLCVIWKYDKNKAIVPGIVMASDGDVRTFSKISTTKQIKTCKYIIFNTNIEYLNKHQFVRKGEPMPIGFGGEDSYIVTLWETAG